jgi:hypothetical protein
MRAVGSGTVELIRDGFGGLNLAAGFVLQKTQPFGADQKTAVVFKKNVCP